MSYRIDLVRDARAELEALPADVRAHVPDLLDELAVDPRPERAWQLSDEPDIQRIWLVRRWRIAYEVNDEDGRVIVLRVRRKQNVDFADLSWMERQSAWGQEAEVSYQGRSGDESVRAEERDVSSVWRDR